MRNTRMNLIILSTLFFGMALPSFAVHHLMQISHIVPDVYGDTSAQAIELRMRASGQNQLSGSRVRAYDAAGANPVLIFDFNTSVANGNLGDTVLLTTEAFNEFAVPDAVPDFTMTNRIPDSYFPAGKLTFEEDNGTILWALAWGGNNYTGSNTGSTDNDDDGDFGAAIGPLTSPILPIIKTVLGVANVSTANNLNYTGITSDLLQNNARAEFVLDLRERKITVKRPKASDVLQAGESFKIRWVTEGSLGDKVRIDLFDDGTKVDTIKKKKNNIGKHKWKVPNNTPGGSNYQVQVTDKDSGTSDLSNTFTINGN